MKGDKTKDRFDYRLNAEVVERYIENNRFHLKIVSFILITVASVAAYFHIGKYQAMDLYYRFMVAVVVFLVYGFAIFLLESELLGLLARYKTGESNKPQKLVYRLVVVQPLTTFAIVSFIVGYVSGAVAFEYRYKQNLEAVVQIEDWIDIYVKKHGISPTALSEVASRFPSATYWMQAADRTQYSYKKIGRRKYQLRFAGADGELGTSDDVVTTSGEGSLEDFYRSNFPEKE